MRIVMIMPSLQLGGLEGAASTMANFLSAAGHEVSVVLCYRTARFYVLRDDIGLFEPRFTRGTHRKSVFYLRWLLFVRRTVRGLRPDVVLSYGDFHNALVLMALGGSGLRVVISDRASPGLRFPWHVGWLRRKVYRRAAGVLAQTGRAAQAQRTLTGDNVPIVTIPNPVRVLGQHGAGLRQQRVLAAARHYPVKGLDRLIEAFARVDADDWELWIAGSEGPATSDLREQVMRAQLGERVRFLGPVRNMEHLYSTAGLFVLPSRSEGYPNALIEAMAHGCPSVAFDIDAGPREIIGAGINGLLVPDGDIAGLTCAIQRLIDDDQLREELGHRASEVGERNSLTRIGERLEEFLTSVVGTPRGQETAGSSQSRAREVVTEATTTGSSHKPLTVHQRRTTPAPKKKGDSR